MQCRRFIVTGRVQGVWFRDSSRRKALELQLTGQAINLPDGSVEVIACGEPANLDSLHTWLHEGPELARVDTVRDNDLPVQDFQGFSIG